MNVLSCDLSLEWNFLLSIRWPKFNFAVLSEHPVDRVTERFVLKCSRGYHLRGTCTSSPSRGGSEKKGRQGRDRWRRAGTRATFECARKLSTLAPGGEREAIMRCRLQLSSLRRFARELSHAVASVKCQISPAAPTYARRCILIKRKLRRDFICRPWVLSCSGGRWGGGSQRRPIE